MSFPTFFLQMLLDISLYLNTLAISVVAAYVLQCKKNFELHEFDWQYSSVYVAHSLSSQEITRRGDGTSSGATASHEVSKENTLCYYYLQFISFLACL